MDLLRRKVGRERARVCNERCYNAKANERNCKGKGTICMCICGGKNHGVGETQARENVRNYFARIMASPETVPLTGRVEIILHQQNLFGGDA